MHRGRYAKLYIAAIKGHLLPTNACVEQVIANLKDSVAQPAIPLPSIVAP